MGQSHQSTLADEKQLAKVFSVQGRQRDQNITYLQHNQTGKQYLLREAVFNEETDELDLLTRLKQRQGFGNPHLTNLIKYEHGKKEDLCSKYYRVHSLWDYPRRTLAEEVNERALAKQPFPPGQIRLMIRQLSEAMATLQKQRIVHECLTSRTVLVEGATTFRVVDPVCVPMHPNLEVLYHKRSIKNVYLSPEQCGIIEQQDLSKLVPDPYRSDVFTAGMLVLEAGLLQRQDDCYEDDCSRINPRKMAEKIAKFGDLYGSELRGFVELMLARDVGERAHWDQLVMELEEQKYRRQEARNQAQSSVRDTLISALIPNRPAPQNGQPINHGQPRPQTVTFPQRRIVEEPPAYQITKSIMVPEQRGQPPPRYEPRPQTMQVNVSPPRSYRPPQQKAVNAPVVRVTARPSTTVHYPAPMPIAEPALKEPTTHSKTHNSSEPKGPQSGAHKSQFSPQPHISEPQQVIEFDQNEPIYSIDEFKNGSKYQGYKFKGKREGWGKYTYQEGGCYEGEWRNDLMCGRGKLFYQSGKLAYEGYLENDLFHGTGTLYNQQPEKLSGAFDFQNFDEIDEFWVSYEGQFRQDKKEGQGKLQLSNGEFFEGSFHEDKVEGEGRYLTVKGREVRGVWHDNSFQRQL